LHEAAKEDFVRLVAGELDIGHGRGQFDQLVLVAPPGVLTELKKALSKPMVLLVVDHLQKDLTKVPDHDLTEHLLPSTCRRSRPRNRSRSGACLGASPSSLNAFTLKSLDRRGGRRIVLKEPCASFEPFWWP
jgi:hypothetical protein